MKICHTCHLNLPEDNYQKNKLKTDGLEYQCRKCSSRRQKTMYVKHKSKVLNRGKKRYWNDPEHKLVMNRRWYQNNRDIHKILRKRWYKKNKERKREIGRAWLARHPGIRSVYVLRRKAKMRGNGGKLSFPEWQEILSKYDNTCLRCGRKGDVTMDHIIPISKGGRHDKDNVQPLCHTCNMEKFTSIIDYRPPDL